LIVRVHEDELAPRGPVVPVLERLRALAEPSLILVECDDHARPIDEVVLEELQWLPHLLVAHSGSGEADTPLTRACDLVIAASDGEALERQLEALEEQVRRPAVVVLAQLLRRSHLSEPVRLHLESLSYATLQGSAEFEAWLASQQS
jgi:hypothetical protein